MQVPNWLWILLAVALLGLLVMKPVLNSTASQEVWQGVLRADGLELRLVLRISKAPDGTMTATLDSVDQGALNLPVDTLTIENQAFRFEMKSLGARYEGTLNEDGTEVVGVWTQGGRSFPLTFKRLEPNAER